MGLDRTGRKLLRLTGSVRDVGVRTYRGRKLFDVGATSSGEMGEVKGHWLNVADGHQNEPVETELVPDRGECGADATTIPDRDQELVRRVEPGTTLWWRAPANMVQAPPPIPGVVAVEHNRPTHRIDLIQLDAGLGRQRVGSRQNGDPKLHPEWHAGDFLVPSQRSDENRGIQAGEQTGRRIGPVTGSDLDRRPTSALTESSHPLLDQRSTEAQQVPDPQRQLVAFRRSVVLERLGHGVLTHAGWPGGASGPTLL